KSRTENATTHPQRPLGLRLPADDRKLLRRPESKVGVASPQNTRTVPWGVTPGCRNAKLCPPKVRKLAKSSRCTGTTQRLLKTNQNFVADPIEQIHRAATQRNITDRSANWEMASF